ncbi:1-acyl-sn-glycerol-3-phosphate acyltransferase [Candidatus Rariloculus sp.]|uniref:1-acyl-sn-glycerol-3-phosphate acyltransferase n=1 Tax=Candidatus Rariloculus sp. TaxID=3101265 RepID=UPI003D0C1647
MLYRALVRFLSLVARTFYKQIDVVGLENVPARGAVILAGNHPNALIDGLLLISQAGRTPVHFLGNAKLWKIPVLARLLDTLGAVPVLRREEHGPDADNRGAFERVDDVLACGGCVAIFPEGISHADSRLTTLKTGAARMALNAAARRGSDVTIVPFGLTYFNRHRFRSQVLLHFAAPMPIDEHRLAAYENDEVGTVRQLTAELRKRLSRVTLNAPDWETLRFIHAARRLYKPISSKLKPEIHVELSRRFVDRYTRFAGEPDIQRLRREIEAYQAQLDLLGLKDYQLGHRVSAGIAMKRIVWRTALVVLLLPLALPGAIIALPAAWLGATAGTWFSYDVDDIATLKVTTAVPVLLTTYALFTVAAGVGFGWGWAMLAILLLPASFFATLFVLEKQAQLLASIRSVFRLARLSGDIEALDAERKKLVTAVRTAVDRYADPAIRRIFDAPDFDSQ